MSFIQISFFLGNYKIIPRLKALKGETGYVTYFN